MSRKLDAHERNELAAMIQRTSLAMVIRELVNLWSIKAVQDRLSAIKQELEL